MADSSQTQIAYIAEATYGVTPATPAFKNLRFTQESLVPNIGYVSSNEIRPDRNIPDLTQVSGEAQGGIGFELSYGSFDDILEGLLQSTWSTNVLKNGVTGKSFTIEKKFENGVTDQFHRYVGARVNSMSLSVQAKQIVTGSFDFMAKGCNTGTAIISGATYTAANTNPVMNAASNLQNLAMSGITSPNIMSLSMNITNNLRQQPVVGSIQSLGIGSGRFAVTGQMEAYFANSDMFDAYVNNTATDLAFDIGGVSSLKYNIKLGKLKFGGAEVIAGGNDQDVMARMSFQGIYNASDLSSIVITRTP